MPIPVIMQGYQGEASVHTRALRTFAAALPPAFAPQVTPDITREGHNATDLFTRTESGATHVMHFAASYLAHRVPRSNSSTCPSATTAATRFSPRSTAPSATASRLTSPPTPASLPWASGTTARVT